MIETQDIRVDYGEVTAVSDVSLSIEKGEIYALIGPNGAGKTSLIRVLATLREPTYGEVRIAGMDVDEHLAKVRRTIGYMPDMAPVYKDLRCWEFLDLFAGAYFVSRHERRARVDASLDAVNLTSKRTAMAGTLSRGMTQRLVLAKTLLHDPSVLLLDEPASGLDPLARIELRELLKKLASEGRAILISSHHLAEVGAFCTSMGVMERGRMVLDGPIDEIIAGLGTTRRYTVETVGPGENAAAFLRTRPEVNEIECVDGRCTFEASADDEAMALLLAGLVEGGVRVKAFYERRRGVEDVLMQIGASEVS